MTKEEKIEKAKNWFYSKYMKGINDETNGTFNWFERMQEYADQETERLRIELEKTIETAKTTSVIQRQHIERLQNELNELKEKHKRDVKTAYLNGVIDTCNGINIDSETYYKKFESNG